MEENVATETDTLEEPGLLSQVERQIKILKLILSILIVSLILLVAFTYNLKQQMDIKFKNTGNALLFVNKKMNNSIDGLNLKTDDTENRLTDVESKVDDIDSRLINLNI